MMKIKNNIIFRCVALLLCVVMTFSLFACNSEMVDPIKDSDRVIDAELLSAKELSPVKDGATVETMKVVVFAANAFKGNVILESSVSLVDMPITDLPLDPITSIEDALGKYVLNNAAKGECVTASNLSNTDPFINMTGLGEDYVLISNVINKYKDEKDMAVVIQKAIEENPGKTIYFPDGKYNLSKTVIIPSEEGKSVSFRFSNYATLGPSTNWDRNCTALIQYGKPEDAKTQPGDHTDYIMGGTFDCSGSLTAIEINGGGRLFVNNISIENAKIGIHLKPNAAYNNLENVNITARTERSTKGIFVEGTNNSLINMRIYRVMEGVHLTGGDNVLINIHPLFSGTNSFSAIGFHDESTGNRYNICYSDQYMIGFKMASHTRSYYDMCYVYWWAAISYEIGFLCEGEFNSVITDSLVNFQNVKETTKCYYICSMEKTPEVEETESESGTSEILETMQTEFATEGVTQDATETEASDSTSQNLPSAPKGNGKIVNPIILSERNMSSDAKFHKQFIYKYK